MIVSNHVLKHCLSLVSQTAKLTRLVEAEDDTDQICGSEHCKPEHVKDDL